MQKTIKISGIPISYLRLSQFAEWLAEKPTAPGGIPVRLVNSYSLALTRRDPAYCDTLSGVGINLPDGLPVFWVLRLLNKFDAGGSLGDRVRGPSLFDRTIYGVGRPHLRHFLLGATPHTLSRLADTKTDDGQSPWVVGSYAPPYVELQDMPVSEMIARITEANPDVIWIGLGTPKQDYLAITLAGITNLPCIAVGAAFDFKAGVVREAPSWIQAIGFEWLYRLIQEPKRLWRRYLFGNFTFAAMAAKAVLEGVRTSANRDRP